MTQRKFHPRARKLFVFAVAWASLSVPRAFAQQSSAPAPDSSIASSTNSVVSNAATTAAPPASPVHFQISAPKLTYRVGELIPIDLLFSADAPGAFRVHTNPFANAPMGIVDTLTIEPEGAIQPRVSRLTKSIRALRFGLQGVGDPLTPAPVHIHVLLNEWLLLDHPGTFRLRIETDRVAADLGEAQAPPPFHLQSNTVEITLVSADAAWQAAELNDIRHILDTSEPIALSFDNNPRTDAVQRLRYLDTEASAREIARRFGQNRYRENELYSNALFESTHQVAAIDEMNRLLDDRDFPVIVDFAMTLAALPIEGDSQRAEIAQRYNKNMADIVAKLNDALPAKRGRAFTTTFATLEELRPLAFDDSKPTPQAVSALLAQFGSLPADEQNMWLSQNWTDISDPSWLPTVRALALGDDNSSGPADDQESMDRSQTRAAALSRWYELDPDSAREAILADIVSPDPRFDSGTLGLLKDTTLPAQERQIAQNFLDAKPDSLGQSASLLFRYADADVWPDVSDKIAQVLPQLDCPVRFQALAFALRVAPDSAGPLLDSALTAPNSDGDVIDCAGSMFTEVGDLQNGPALEKAAVSSLNDPRLAVAENAASYLGQHGSAPAEKPLWDRFQAWTSDWLGLDKNSVDPVAIQAIAEQLGLGDTLRNALVRGPGWLTNQEKLMHIDSLWEQLPDVNSDSSKPLLDLWNNPPLTIHCRLNDDGGGFRFRLAQYSLLGAEALQDKLSQFPSGTSFLWDGSQCADSPDANALYSQIASSASIAGATLKPAPAPAAGSGNAAAQGSGDGDDDGDAFEGVLADRVVVVE